MLYIFVWKVMTFTSIKYFFIFSHCYIFEETEVQAPGQHPDKGYSKVNMVHLAPGAFQTGEGNFTNHAEGTLNMGICTCLPPNGVWKKGKRYRFYGQYKQHVSVMADNLLPGAIFFSITSFSTSFLQSITFKESFQKADQFCQQRSLWPARYWGFNPSKRWETTRDGKREQNVGRT